MFHVQQGSKKERSKLAVLSAPANMLSFRSPSTISQTQSQSQSSAQPGANTSASPASPASPLVNGDSQPKPQNVTGSSSAQQQPTASTPSSAALAPRSPTKQSTAASQPASNLPSASSAGSPNPPKMTLPSMEQVNPFHIGRPPSPQLQMQQTPPHRHANSHTKSDASQQQQQLNSSKAPPGARTLLPGLVQVHHPHPKDHQYEPTSAYLPQPLPGPASSLADMPRIASPIHGRTIEQPPAPSGAHKSSQKHNQSQNVPQSRRAPANPEQAPGVSFRSTLRPPSSAQIPDIPYGDGQGSASRGAAAGSGRVGRRNRSVSGASNSTAATNVTTGTAASSGTATLGGTVKAKTFTPSDAHTNIRIGEDTPTNKKGADFASRNAAGVPVHTIVASSAPAAARSQPASSPSALVSPAAPLTVNAPIVPARDTVVTPLDPQYLENFKETTYQSPASVPYSPQKQPAKSALKAKSWADLVRPPNNVQLAEQAVKDMGFTAEQIAQNERNKKRVSIALPSSHLSDSASESSSALTGRAPQVVRVPTNTHIHTSVGNDKSPRHVSPPPERSGPGENDKASNHAELANGEKPAAGPAEFGTSPGRAPSVMSNASSGSALLSNMMSKKRNLEDILAGVETSASKVTLYPRGLVNTGNACFMNSILQTLLFTAPFYNLISLVGLHTTQDLSGRTPLLDAMVSYLLEFKTYNPERESMLNRGESYDESLHKSDAFIPTIIYHALNHNTKFAQMGFHTPSGLTNGSAAPSSLKSAPLTQANLKNLSNANNLSQEDAQEFLGFFLETLHEELLIKCETFDKQRWERASKGIRAGMDSLSRQSVNSLSEFEAIQAPPSQTHGGSVTGAPSSSGAADTGNVSSLSGATNGGDGPGVEDDEWLEVGSKGRTATTRTTETQESAITRIFGGQLRSVLRCPGQKDSVTLEPYMSLQLEIQAPQIRSVTDALVALADPERLSDVNNRQNLKVEATKQIFIETLPPVLILHLKRFIYDNRAGGVLKSHKIISYDAEFEVPKECIAPARRNTLKRNYRLTGVVYHHGKSASGGHYTTSQRQANGRWINIDDTTITPISASEATVDGDREKMRLSLPSASALAGVPEKSAYLLFYQRI